MLAAGGCIAPTIKVRAVDEESGQPRPGVAVHDYYVSWQPHIPLCYPIPIRFPSHHKLGVTDEAGAFESKGRTELYLKDADGHHVLVRFPSRFQQAILRAKGKTTEDVFVKLRASPPGTEILSDEPAPWAVPETD